MARSDRLLRLLHLMRVTAPPLTAARLAEASEVSLRSLYRDIDALRAAGARIEGERGYGYRLVEDPALPPQTFTRAEIEAIALGLAEVRSMGDPAMAEAASSVLAKVAASLSDRSESHLLHAISQVFRPEPRYRETTHMSAIREACWQEEALRIRYGDERQTVSERTILPLAVVHTDRTLTVLSWCGLREDFRMFRADRIQALERTGESFRPRRVALLRRYLAQLRERARQGRGSTER